MRRLLFLVAATLLACGGRPLPLRETAPGDRRDAGRDAVAIPGDGGDAVATPRLPCRFDEPDPQPHPAMVVAVDGTVTLVMTDGTLRTLYRFEPYPPPGDRFFGAAIDEHAGHVVATASWWGPPASPDCTLEGSLICPASDRVVMLDHQGRILWEKTFSGRRRAGGIGVDARAGDGGFVVARGFDRTILIGPDGDEQDLPTAAPVSRPFPGPSVPVLVPMVASRRNAFGWWRPGRGLELTEFSVASPPDLIDEGTELAFAATAGDGSRVVLRAEPDRILSRPISVELPEPASFASGAWRGDVVDGEVVRLNLLTGESARFPSMPPAGMRVIAGGIDHNGWLLGVLRNDYWAAVFRSADAASGWTQIGKTFAGVEQVTVRDVAGTIVVDARKQSSFGPPRDPWQIAPVGQEPELTGTSYQIVRPAEGVATQIQPGISVPVTLSRDGRCAAYWEDIPGGPQLTVHDVVRGSKFPTIVNRSAIALHPRTIWIE